MLTRIFVTSILSNTFGLNLKCSWRHSHLIFGRFPRCIKKTEMIPRPHRKNVKFNRNYDENILLWPPQAATHLLPSFHLLCKQTLDTKPSSPFKTRNTSPLKSADGTHWTWSRASTHCFWQAELMWSNCKGAEVKEKWVNVRHWKTNRKILELDSRSIGIWREMLGDVFLFVKRWGSGAISQQEHIFYREQETAAPWVTACLL